MKLAMPFVGEFDIVLVFLVASGSSLFKIFLEDVQV